MPIYFGNYPVSQSQMPSGKSGFTPNIERAICKEGIGTGGFLEGDFEWKGQRYHIDFDRIDFEQPNAPTMGYTLTRRGDTDYTIRFTPHALYQNGFLVTPTELSNLVATLPPVFQQMPGRYFQALGNVFKEKLLQHPGLQREKLHTKMGIFD